MSILFCLDSANQNTLQACRAGDALLLHSDAVLLLSNNCWPELRKTLPEQLSIFALRTDCTLRGMDQQLPDDCTLIDYSDWVKLTQHHHLFIPC